MSTLVQFPEHGLWIDPFDVDGVDEDGPASSVLLMRGGQRVPVDETAAATAAWVNAERERQQPPLRQAATAIPAFPHPTRGANIAGVIG